MVPRRLLGAALVTLALAHPARGGESGPFAALRAGYGLPLGDAVAGARLSDAVGRQVPLWLDLGWRFDERLALALFGQYGFAGGMGCGAGASCTGSTVRFGAEILYRFLPDSTFDPWAGAGVGWEMARTSSSASGLETRSTFQGFELANLQAGGDWRIAPRFTAGPWVSLTFARYGSLETTTPLGSQPDVSGKAFHLWLELGLMGRFDF
jgi:hypothetical protein